jgi:malonyl-CoA O-methyltransferase
MDEAELSGIISPVTMKSIHCRYKKVIGRSFSGAASSYDRLADLQREVGLHLLSRLDEEKRYFGRIVDLGAGTGFCTEKLTERFPESSILALDIAEGMLKQAQERVLAHQNVSFCVGDAEQLPVTREGTDLLLSNLAIQWCSSDRLFEGFYRVLKRDGLLLFSSFGPETLCELKQAWKQVDDHQHVNEFSDTRRLEILINQAGFKNCLIERVELKRYYKSAFELMRELKGIGAHTVTEGRVSCLTGKGKMLKMVEAYESIREEQGIPATWEIVYGFARK